MVNFALSKFYKNKKILITGVTGFKGSWMALWLTMLGSKVYGIGFQPNKNKKLFYDLRLQKKINLKLFDIRNYNKLNNLIKKNKPEIIFHLAAQPLILESYKKPYETFDINIKGTLNILEITKKTSFVRSLVIVTSDKCYESNNSTKGFKEEDRLGGVDPYSASKSSMEIITRAYFKSFFEKKKKKIGISTGRAGNVIGGGDWSQNRIIPDSIKSIFNEKTVLIRNPNFNRPWQHVLEPIKGYLILAMKQFKKPDKYSGAWNFGTKPNSVTSVKKIVNLIIKFWGSGTLKTKNSKLYEQVNLQLNISKAQRLLNWQPTYDIKKSVEFTVSWYKQILKNKKRSLETCLLQIKKYMHDSKIH